MSRNRKDWSKEHKNKVDAAIRKRKRSLLTKDEVLWLFAVKDGCTKYHYNLHYGVYEDQPSEYNIVSILNQLMSKHEAWNRAIQLLWMDKYMYQAIRKKDQMYLHEWLFLAIQDWAIHLDVYWFYERVGEDWEDWVDEAREQWSELKIIDENYKDFETYRAFVREYRAEKL